MFEYETRICGKRIIRRVEEKRVERIKEEVSQGRLRDLKPGDFFIAYKLGIVEDDQRSLGNYTGKTLLQITKRGWSLSAKMQTLVLLACGK